MGALCTKETQESGLLLQKRFSFVDSEANKENKIQKAWDSASQQYVAVKRWPKADLAGVREVSVLSALSHPGIPLFFCSFEEDGTRYLVREWVEGISLEQFRRREDFSLSEQEILQLFSQLCEIICYLHDHPEGPLIHMDLKPANVLYRCGQNDGGKPALMLIDFEGVQSLRAPQDKNPELDDTIRLTSPFYTAPEALCGEFLPECDIYSLGAILFFLLTGRAPRYGEVFPGRGRFRHLLKRCLAREPEKRFSSVRELLRTSVVSMAAPSALPEKQKCGSRKMVLFPGHFLPDWRRLVVTVDGNLCFACELAYLAAKVFQLRVALFATSPWLENRMGYFLDKQVRESSLVCEDDEPFFLAGGIHPMLRKPSEDWLREEMLEQSRMADSLFVGRSVAFSRYFQKQENDMREFCLWGYRNFDLVILVTDLYQDNSYRQSALKYSDTVLAAPCSNIEEIERSCSYYDGLSEAVGTPSFAVRYVAWEYHGEASLPEKGISFLVGASRYLGPVSFQIERLRCRNSGTQVFCTSFQDTLAKEYGRILNGLLCPQIPES